MKQKDSSLEDRYQKCAAQLSSLGYICQGSVYARAKGKAGSRYLWSWKNREQKTESLTLSIEQYNWLKKAIANQRKVERLLADLRKISCSILLNTIPGPARRN